MKSLTSDMYRSYEQDYKLHMEQIMTNLLAMTQKANEKQDNQVKQIQEEISETEQCLRQMELEASMLPMQFKKEIIDTIKQYRKDMAEVEKDFKKLQYDESYNQNKLFEGRQINQALLQQEDRLAQQSLKLLGAKQVALQVEDQANQVQSNLYNQSNQMQGMKSKTRSVRDELGTSFGLIGTMKGRITQRKMLVYGVIGFIFACFLIILLTYLW
ncbi:hypothetical protein pb186bvf_011359 [Paramecium bursaria]